MKKGFALVVAIILIVIGVSVVYIDIEPLGFDITIKNETAEEITDLYITYHEIIEEIKIPPIAPGGKYKLTVRPKEEFGENSMTMYYLDTAGIKREETIFGYFEEGYYGEATIVLNSIDQQGVIKMIISEKMFD
jgi:hypothetical protein